MKVKKEIIRYLIVTPFVGAADFGIYFLLIRFLPNSVSKGISYIIANGADYLLNKYWIFKRKQKQAAAPEVGRYFILDVVLFVCNVGINQLSLYVWPHAVFLALAIASAVTALLSFIFKKWWVFKTSSA
ncbi:MAG: GtrA family protein [Candidatus Omnitrophica bacterium]|nr:GtrA family protein [Candidatus Omnitrophota bacterium]